VKFVQRARRRTRAGIYLARVDRHFRRPWQSRRVNGYVGRSWDVPARMLCHEGVCGRHANCHPKPWTIGLNHRFRWVRVPWWLSWKWSMAIMEAAAICVLLPLYNVQLNTKNPRRIPPSVARLQAAARVAGRRGYWATETLTAGGRRVFRLGGATIILIGIVMTAWSNIR